MQFSKIIIAAASAATLVSATPVFPPEAVHQMIERADDATAPAPAPAPAAAAAAGTGDIGACETKVAAEQVACLSACTTAACYTDW